MIVRRKILPVIFLMSAYVHWLKPRVMTTSVASATGKSMMLLLCARSRFLIPMIVFTALWVFDRQMQIDATVSLTFVQNARFTLGRLVEVPDDSDDSDSDSDDDDDSDSDQNIVIPDYSDSDDSYDSLSEATPSEQGVLLNAVENALLDLIEIEEMIQSLDENLIGYDRNH